MHILTMFYVLLALYNSWHIFVISILLVAFSKCHIRHMFVIFSIIGVFVKTLFYRYSKSVLRYFQNPLEIVTTASIIYLFATLPLRAHTHPSSQSWLVHFWPNVGTTAPTLGQRWANSSSIHHQLYCLWYIYHIFKSMLVLFESMCLHAPLLLTWYIFNPDMDKWSHAQ